MATKAPSAHASGGSAVGVVEKLVPLPVRLVAVVIGRSARRHGMLRRMGSWLAAVPGVCRPLGKVRMARQEPTDTAVVFHE